MIKNRLKINRWCFK